MFVNGTKLCVSVCRIVENAWLHFCEYWLLRQNGCFKCASVIGMLNQVKGYTAVLAFHSTCSVVTQAHISSGEKNHSAEMGIFIFLRICFSSMITYVCVFCSFNKLIHLLPLLLDTETNVCFACDRGREGLTYNCFLAFVSHPNYLQEQTQGNVNIIFSTNLCCDFVTKLLS